MILLSARAVFPARHGCIGDCQASVYTLGMLKRTTTSRNLRALGLLVIVLLVLSTISATGTLIGLAGILVFAVRTVALSRNRGFDGILEELRHPTVHRDASSWRWSRTVVIVSATVSIMVWAFAIGFQIEHALYLIPPAILAALMATIAAAGAYRPS